MSALQTSSSSYYKTLSYKPNPRDSSLPYPTDSRPFRTERRQSAIGSSFSSTQEQSAVDRAIAVYERSLYFHGSDAQSAASIRKHGMCIERKLGGSTAVLRNQYGLDDPEAKKYNYVMTVREAAEYAKMYSSPAIVRMIVPATIRLEVDPEADSSTQFRTDQNISKYLVLPERPEELHTHQLKKINKELGLPEMNRDQLKALKARVTGDLMFDVSPYLAKAKSYLAQESERDSLTQQMLQSKGIDLSSLQPGQEFSFSPEELEALLNHRK